MENHPVEPESIPQLAEPRGEERSSIGMKTSPPSESAEKTRSASASLSTLSDR